MKILKLIANGIGYFLSWGNPSHPYAFWRGIGTMVIIFILFVFISMLVGCESDEQAPSVSSNPEMVHPVQNTAENEKRGGNGKGNANGQNNPNNPNYNPPPPPPYTVLPYTIDNEINLTYMDAGGCTKMDWDNQVTDGTGYSIRFVNNCSCSTTQVDSVSVPGETHYIKHYNATQSEAWIGCLWEIGKFQTYDIRILWWTRDTVAREITPHYSKIYEVYVY